MYQKRKDFLEGMLKAEAAKLSNQARFIKEKCDRVLVVENKKRKTIVDELIKRGYEADPVKEWKKRVAKEEDEEDGQAEAPEEEAVDEQATSKKPVDPGWEIKRYWVL